MENLLALLLRQTCFEDLDQLREAKARGFGPVTHVLQFLRIACLRCSFGSHGLMSLSCATKTRRAYGSDAVPHEFLSIHHGRSSSLL
jgi:hypothetical protein